MRFISTLTEEGENVHALIIGPPSTRYYLRELTELAQELQVADRVTIVPDAGG